MVKEKEKRNGIISLFKFIFSLIVVIYHGKKLVGIDKFKLARMGYLCVDFFFIVSGYYFYKSILNIKKKEKIDIYKENVKLILSKLKKFLPYTIISGFISIILFLFLKELKISNALMSIFNIFLIDMTGLVGYTINGPVWYISSMLLVFFVLLPIIYKLDDKYIYYICPIIVLFGLGYMYKTYPNLDLYRSKWHTILYSGTVKAFIEINIGILIYNISKKIKIVLNDKKKIYRILLCICYCLLYVFISLFFIFYKRLGVLDYFVLILISFTLLLNFSDTLFCHKIDCKFIRYLEKISLPIFINQQLFLNYFTFLGKKFPKQFYIYLILYVSCTIIFSILEQAIIDAIKRAKLKN